MVVGGSLRIESKSVQQDKFGMTATFWIKQKEKILEQKKSVRKTWANSSE